MADGSAHNGHVIETELFDASLRTYEIAAWDIEIPERGIFVNEPTAQMRDGHLKALLEWIASEQ